MDKTMPQYQNVWKQTLPMLNAYPTISAVVICNVDIIFEGEYSLYVKHVYGWRNEGFMSSVTHFGSLIKNSDVFYGKSSDFWNQALCEGMDFLKKRIIENHNIFLDRQ